MVEIQSQEAIRAFNISPGGVTSQLNRIDPEHPVTPPGETQPLSNLIQRSNEDNSSVNLKSNQYRKVLWIVGKPDTLESNELKTLEN